MSIYIHIPFCSNICSYCDFAKVFYNEELVNKYLEELNNEIKDKYKGEIIDTIYIGGGTPTSLNVDQLNKLFSIISVFKLSNDYEFTIECNVEDTSIEKLELFKLCGINRLSIGVQSFNEKHLKFLNRKHNANDVYSLLRLVKNIGFKNISVDLIYGLPEQSIAELDYDIESFLKLDINHISCYSLIVEEHTKIYIAKISNIDEDLDADMYNLICTKLKAKNFVHYEISNFGKEGYFSKHNLVYWNNERYYGFGAGASGYVGNIRYDNTRSITTYIANNHVMNQINITKDIDMENEFMLGFRKVSGINKNEFKTKFDIEMRDILAVKKLLKGGLLVDDGDNIFIKEEYLYISNSILIEFIK